MIIQEDLVRIKELKKTNKKNTYNLKRTKRFGITNDDMF